MLSTDKTSLKGLKDGLREVLRANGAIGSVKAQLRKEFISEMSKCMKPLGSDLKFSTSIIDRVLYSTIHNFLLQRGMLNSLSVFTAESGHDSKDYLFSDMDIVSLLSINTQSSVYKYISSDKENGASSSKPSLLQMIVESMKTIGSPKHDQGTQCDEAFNSVSNVDFVDNQLKTIRQIYSARKAEESRFPAKSLDERMIQFERECEERHRRNLELQITYIRENEVNRARMEERKSARHEIEVLRNELESDYKRRNQLHMERESELTHRAEEKERIFQKTIFDARQQMQRDIDDMRIREDAAVRKIDLENQGLRVLEMRLKETQLLIEARDRELVRKEQGDRERLR